MQGESPFQATSLSPAARSGTNMQDCITVGQLQCGEEHISCSVSTAGCTARKCGCVRGGGRGTESTSDTVRVPFPNPGVAGKMPACPLWGRDLDLVQEPG